MNILTQASLFFGEIILIYFLSRMSLQKTYLALKKYIKNDSFIIALISFFFIPGTIIHEVSHYIVALFLNMHPRDMSIFPSIEGRAVRLGHVIYERKKGDFIRPILIGIAPVFGGLLSLWFIIQVKLFPGGAWWQTILFGYFILAISANMFSSRQDLIDAGYLVPIGLIIALLFFLFPLRIDLSFVTHQIPRISYFITTLQTPLLFSLLIHGILVLLLIKFK